MVYLTKVSSVVFLLQPVRVCGPRRDPVEFYIAGQKEEKVPEEL